MSRRFSFWRINYGTWLRRVLAWDGLLPVGVVLLPYIVQTFFPNRRAIMEVTAVLLPVAAFFLRVGNGRRQIASNQCSKVIRRLQYSAFCLGILPLVLIDCVLILSHLMPPGALFQARSDLIVWMMLAGIYLASMVIAMYPGQTLSDNEWDSSFHVLRAELEQPRRDR